MKLHSERIEPECWEIEAGTPGCAHPRNGGDDFVLVVAGCFLHVFAVQVTIDGDGNQVPVNGEFDREVAYVQDQAQEPVDTVQLPGLEGQWVVLTEPFA